MVGQISSTLTITIKKQAENYTIEASGTKGIKVDPQLAPQLKTLLSDQQINNTLKDLSSPTTLATTDPIQKLGKALYDSLFTDRDILLAFGKVQGSASSDSGARLRLQIEPTELAALPWETLNDGKDWLSAQSTTPLVRKLTLSNNRKPLQKLQVRGALRILFVGASPEDLVPLKVEETADELERLLEEPIKKKRIVFDKLLNATPEELQQGLLKDYHILYFAGHGSPEGIFLDDGQGDVIEKEGKVIGRETGDKSLVSAETLAQALKGKQTRLVFLAACETGKASEGSLLLRGFAQELAERSNLPAIVAMQYFISDMQANPLTTQFFAALAAGRPVDVAMAEARSVLMKKGQVSRDVFSPVLYLQAEDGALFPKAKNWPAISAFTLAGAFLIVVVYQVQHSQRQQVEQWAADAGNQLPLNAAISTIAATGLSQSAFVQFPDHPQFVSVEDRLLDVIAFNREQNQILHVHEVSSVAFSPDGQRIVSADNTVHLWDAKTGKPIWDAPIGKPFNPNDYVAKPFPNWDAPIGKTNWVSVAFSPDGQRIVSGSEDGSVQIWDAKTGKPIDPPLIGHTGWVKSLSFSPDGQRIVSGSRNSTQIWDANTGAPIGKPMKGAFSLAFSPDGQRIVSSDSMVHLWEIKTGKPIWDAPISESFGHGDEVRSVAFSPDGQRIVSGSLDNTMRLWDAKTGKPIDPPLIGHTGWVMSVAFSPDGQRIVSGSDDKTVRLWDASSGQPIGKPLKGHAAAVYSVTFSPDGQSIVSGSKDKTVRRWDAKTGALIRPPLIGHTEGVESVAFSPDSKRIVSGSGDSTQIWDANTGAPIGKPMKGAFSLAFSPDRQSIVSADNTVHLWDAKTGKPLWDAPISPSFNAHADWVSSVAFSPDGQSIVSGHGNHTVRLWYAKTGKPIRPPLTGHADWVSSVAFSPDGQSIVSGSGDKTVRLWDFKTGKLILPPLTGHTAASDSENFPDNQSISVAFSPDGQRIVSGSWDNTVRLWDFKTGKLIGQPLTGQARVSSVAFSPDGQRIVSGSWDNTVRIWDISAKSLLRKVCNQLRYHPTLNQPTDVAREAKKTCKQYVWESNEQ